MKPNQSNKPSIKKQFHQLLAGGLFAIFLINSVGCFVYVEIKRRSIRHEIKHSILHKLPDSQLVRIINSEYNDKDEFELNGIMYDVMRKETLNGETILWCFEDKKETELNRSIESMVKKDLANSPIKKTQKILLNFLKIPLSIFEKPLFIFQSRISLHIQYMFNTWLTSIFLSVASPPPDLV
ncbi:MAG: hypothetical protein ACOVO2_11945 [Emticicia sp.]|uniref:hypothetical protein n=1 Tax=Emticicia sp. TaxID=1930953 RepID=UPI003BA67B26